MKSEGWFALTYWVIAASASAASTGSPPDQVRNFVVRTFDSDTRFGQKTGSLDRIYVAEAFRRGREAVYLAYDTSDGDCGSGGCTLRVVEAGPDGLRSIGGAPAVRPPFYVARGRRSAWPDIVACRSGGGLLPPVLSRVEFGGRIYQLHSRTSVDRAGSMRKILFQPSLQDECRFP